MTGAETDPSQLTFAQLLLLARRHTAEQFTTQISSPFLIATGTLAGNVRPGLQTGETGMLVLDEGSPSHTTLGRHPLPGRIFAIRKRARTDPARIHVGRSPDNDIVIDEKSISSRQAFFERDGEILFVADAASRNGTHVNLARIEPGGRAPLKDEDVVTFGRVSFQFFTPLPLYYALKAFTEGAV